MTREEKVKFCSICKNRQMNFEKGIVCSLTGEYALFDESCQHFDADSDRISRQMITEKELKAAGGRLIGSKWFLWIGGLSILNTILYFANLQFTFGLISTAITQGIFVGIGSYIMGIVLAAIGAGFFIWTYYLTAKKELLWAYCAGWIMYLLDTLLFIPLVIYAFEFSMVWGIGLHILILMLLYCYNPLIDEEMWVSIKSFKWTHANIGYVVYGSILLSLILGVFISLCISI